MKHFSVKYYRPGAVYPPDAIYILARGMNTGRPADHPNPNCFVFTCDSQDRIRFFWMIHALWTTKRFDPYLRGSVIAFITINDLKNIILSATIHIDRIEKQLPLLNQFGALEKVLQHQLQLIRMGRRQVMAHIAL